MASGPFQGEGKKTRKKGESEAGRKKGKKGERETLFVENKPGSG